MLRQIIIYNQNTTKTYIMNLTTFQQNLIDAIDNNRLEIYRHEPGSVSGLISFIKSRDYTVHEYANLCPMHNPMYMQIIPNPDSSFSITELGVRGFSPVDSFDCLVVSGQPNNKLHIMGVESAKIDSNDDLVYQGPLV
jgi:hypothetical protein